MRLKSFTAQTMKDAMRMVKESLGEDAIIIATKEEQGGKSVRVTAAIDPMEEEFNDFEQDFEGRETSQEEDWLYHDDSDEEGVVEELTEVMLKHAVPEDVTDHIISCASVMGITNPGDALATALENLFKFSPLPVQAYPKAFMMVGPPGSGKTLTVAKMAARACMNGLSVSVITTDTIRAGGIEQLSAFTNLLDISLHEAEDLKTLKIKLAEQEGEFDQILIDTAGANPFNAEDIKTLARLTLSNDIEPLLVLPAGTDADEAGEMARIFATAGVNLLIPSRVDIVRRLGSLLSAAHHGGMSFADVSNTPQVAEGLSALTSRKLTKMLMPHAKFSETAGSGDKFVKKMSTNAKVQKKSFEKRGKVAQ